MAKLKSAQDIEKMREAGQLAARTLRYAGEFVKPGITTDDINTLVHEYTLKHGAYPSPLNYRGFPKSVCTSVNDVICHGIPSKDQILKEGDIINIDVTSTLDGYFGDCSATFYVGTDIPEESRKVTEVAAESLARALAVVRHGMRLGDIGHAIQNYAEDKGCGVVRDFVGHGIGTHMHEDPQVPNYGEAGRGMKLKAGMVIAIEPMVNAGKPEVVVLGDGWTAVTADGSMSAHFEHSVAVTATGAKILTE